MCYLLLYDVLCVVVCWLLVFDGCRCVCSLRVVVRCLLLAVVVLMLVVLGNCVVLPVACCVLLFCV